MKTKIVCFILLLTPTTGLAETKEECVSRWLQAEAAQIVFGVGMVGGTPTVVVDEDTFNSIDYQTKLGLVQTMMCAALGPGKTFGEVEMLGNKTNKRLARWSPYKGLIVD